MMTDEEMKMRAALEAQQRDSKLRSIRGGVDQIGGLLQAAGNPQREYLETQAQFNLVYQEQFVALCKELLPLGAVQVSCGAFQATFVRAQ